MLDIRLIRENPDFVRARLATRGGDAHTKIDAVLAIDTERRAAETRLQLLQGDRKRISKEIGGKKARGEDTSAIEAQVRGIGDEIAQLNERTAAGEQEQRDLLLQLPNLPHADAPPGNEASANPEVRVWGSQPAFAFAPKSNVAASSV